MMKTYRLMAIICLFVIVLITVAMIISLAQGSSERFFVLGGVWVAAILLCFVLVKGFKNRFRKEEKDEGTSED